MAAVSSTICDSRRAISRNQDELYARSHHLVLRLGVDTHHARLAIGDSLAIRVFVEKGLHILNIHCS